MAITGLTLLLLCSYTCGRLHQWHRQGRQRDRAYRGGYDQATRSVLTMAADASTQLAPRPPGDGPTATGRHAAHARDIGATTREIGQRTT